MSINQKQILKPIGHKINNELKREDVIDYLQGLPTKDIMTEYCYFTKESTGNYIPGCYKNPFSMLSDIDHFVYCPFCGKTLKIKEE